MWRRDRLSAPRQMIIIIIMLYFFLFFLFCILCRKLQKRGEAFTKFITEIHSTSQHTKYAMTLMQICLFFWFCFPFYFTIVGQRASIESLTANNATIREGKRLRIVCKVRGQPPPKVTWFKDNRSIPKNRNKYQFVHLR